MSAGSQRNEAAGRVELKRVFCKLDFNEKVSIVLQNTKDFFVKRCVLAGEGGI